MSGGARGNRAEPGVRNALACGPAITAEDTPSPTPAIASPCTPAFALASRTPPHWAPAVAQNLHALLSDHAHCELKAAASALTLIRRPSARPGWALRLTPLVREEIEHLQRVLRELDQRGWTLLPDSPSPYTRALLAAAGAPRRRSEGALDSLLVSALIEQRSHERFERLRECPALAALRPLYQLLAEAEERHGGLFLDLACEVAPREVAQARHAELAAAEAALLAGLPAGPRVHSGPAPG